MGNQLYRPRSQVRRAKNAGNAAGAEPPALKSVNMKRRVEAASDSFELDFDALVCVEVMHITRPGWVGKPLQVCLNMSLGRRSWRGSTGWWFLSGTGVCTFFICV